MHVIAHTVPLQLFLLNFFGGVHLAAYSGKAAVLHVHNYLHARFSCNIYTHLHAWNAHTNCTCINTNTLVDTHMHTIQTCTPHTHACTPHTHTCTHTHTRTRTHTHTHTHNTYTYTQHIHKRVCVCIHAHKTCIYVYTYTTVLLIACGACINGPYQIITSAVSTDLV